MDLSAAEVMICWKLFIVSLIRAGLSSGSVSFSVEVCLCFLGKLASFFFLYAILVVAKVVLSCCGIVSVCDFYGEVVAVIWFF